MKTLVLHTPKGGSGKSTLAREIAVSSAKAGLRTALADLDPQGTTSGWYQRRQSADPALVDIGVAPHSKKIAALADAGFDLLVIDTPPGQPGWMPALLAAADMVLVPVRPTPDDLLAAAPSPGAWRAIRRGRSFCLRCRPGHGCWPARSVNSHRSARWPQHRRHFAPIILRLPSMAALRSNSRARPRKSPAPSTTTSPPS